MTARVITGFLILIALAALSAGCGNNSVESEPIRPTLTSQAPLEAAVGQQYTYDVQSSGDPSPTFRLEQAPAGMTIESVSGQILWVPTSNSSFESRVTVVARNEAGTDSQEFIVQVAGLQIEGWETTGLIAEDINPDTIRAVASDIADGTYPQIHSLVIIRNGNLVFEEYFNGNVRNSTHNIYSAEKTITSCLMGIAIDQGLITDENELLYPFFDEYDSFENWSDWKDEITLKHLHTMTAGFELEGEDYNLWRYDIGPRDWIKFYLDLPVVHEPGTVADYQSLNDRLAGHVIERQAQMTLPEFAAENLFRPLAMRYWEWSAWDPVNSSMITGQLELRPIDMAKFGQMYLDDGIWDGERIVSEAWVTRSTALSIGNYGYNWWVYLWTTPAGGINTYYAFGNGGNGIWVFDSLRMIVVMTGDYFVQPDYWQNQQQILKERIIPAAIWGP